MALPEILATTREHMRAVLANAVTKADPLATIFGLTGVPKGMLRDVNFAETLDYINAQTGTLRLKANLSEGTGGYQYVIPVMLEHAGTAKPRSRLAKAPDQDVGKMLRAVFAIGTLTQSVIIDRQDIAVNSGKERVIALVGAKMEQQWADLYNTFSNKLWTGAGSGNEWAGIQNIITDSAGTVGGLSQSTYTEWNPQRYTTAISSFSTNNAGPNQMADLIAKTGQNPDAAIIVTTSTITGYWAQWAMSNTSAWTMVDTPPKTRAFWATFGAMRATCMGLPVVSSPHVPSQHMYGIDLRHIGFSHTPPAALGDEKVYMVGPVEVGPWMRLAERPVWQMIFEVQGAIVVDKMNCHWVITQIQGA